MNYDLHAQHLGTYRSSVSLLLFEANHISKLSDTLCLQHKNEIQSAFNKCKKMPFEAVNHQQSVDIEISLSCENEMKHIASQIDLLGNNILLKKSNTPTHERLKNVVYQH